MFQKKHLFFLIIWSTFTYGQTYIQANTISTIVLIPNIGIETPISNKLTFQVDVVASFWKSINDAPYQFATLTPEIRYHFKENTNGFYVGAHIGGGIFKIQKWGGYAELNEYQKGFSYFVGATIGYQKKITEKIALDIFLGGGNHQAYYKGYIMGTDERYENAKDYNKSGEFLPYRGGIMFCYKLN